ncbi:TspO/MBR family protein [Luteococcus sp. OSA5]|uniref:TspO/MBR family protein n=1 Tax=Luteococcus sp. OSA5 TaxID=3401630 RepID=UPI003B4395B3
MDTTLRNQLVGTGLATAATAALGSVATIPTSAWFKSLDKPTWQPPNSVFGPVWTALYLDIAVVSAQHLAQLREDGDDEAAQSFQTALGTNLALNAAWSWVFFRGHRLGASTVVAGLLAASSADLVRRVAGVDARRAAVLAPYAGWTGFATVLTDALRRRNR